MSRTWLIRPRRPRAVRDRPATGTRLLPNPHSPNTHYKRCPRAERLRPRSDQPLSRPVPVTGYGRFPDKSRHALLQGSRLRISAPVEGHTYVADVVLAGESQQSDERRLKTNAPFKDSTVVTTGVFPTTNAGHGSPLPSLRVVEHFWCTGLPHTENFSGLVHIPSEVRGCRRVVADVKPPLERMKLISTGVDAFSRNRPGPSIPHSFLLSKHSGLFTPSFLRRQSLPLRRQGNLSPEAGPGRSLPHHPRKAPSTSAAHAGKNRVFLKTIKNHA